MARIGKRADWAPGLRIRSAVCVVTLAMGCRAPVVSDPCPAVKWAAVPLQPLIHFDQLGPQGNVTVLLLDGHSGEPISGGQIALAPSNVAAPTDSNGIGTFTNLLPGRYQLAARGIGYKARRDSLILQPGEGRIRIVQLRRDGLCVVETISAANRNPEDGAADPVEP